MRLYVVLTLLFFYSCSESVKDKKIEPVVVAVPGETDVKSLEIEKIAPLETRDESVFGQYYKVDFIDSDIYILDNIFTNNLYHFNGRGQFIKKLQIGKGPGEVMETYSVYIDREANEVYVYDGINDRIQVFDQLLNYLQTIPVNNEIAYHHFNKMSDNKWLVQATYQNYPRNDTTALYVLLDKEFKRIEEKYIPFNLSFGGVGTVDPISTNAHNQVLFAGIFDNNLYTIDDQDKLQVKYQVDFGDFNLTEKELQSDDNRSITKLWQEGQRKTYLDNVHETILYVGFSYLFEDKVEFCIYSKKSGEILSSENIRGDFIPGTLAGLTDDYFILAAEPSSVIDYINRSEVEDDRFKDLNIKEGDNPVLVYYRLKEML